jgi:hypothetical protein
MKGASRLSTGQKATGVGKLKPGKAAMPVELYNFLGLHLLQSSSKDAVFARTFMLISWNLMCRASNSATIAYSHMGWTSDTLTILFSQMKNDQEGRFAKHSRHVYANPGQPHICVVLALGIFFLYLPVVYCRRGEAL